MSIRKSSIPCVLDPISLAVKEASSMATEIKLPQLAENLTEGEVLSVKVAAGDTVSKGQALLEVEAEKSTAEVPAPVAGKVTEVRVNQGDSIKVGQTILLVEEGAAGNGAQPSAKTEKAPAKEAKTSAAPSRAGESGKRAADAQKKAFVQKAPTEEGAPAKSTPSPAPDGQHEEPAQPAKQAAEQPEQPEDHVVPAGPATRRLARELGVDLSRVRGTGSGGRIVPDDIKNFVHRLASSEPEAAEGQAQATPPLPDFEQFGPVERQTFSGIRRKTAQQTSLAWSQIPHVTQHNVADVTDFESFRKETKEATPKITITAIALKASAVALQEFQSFNASLDAGKGQLVLKQYYHLGVAVDTEHGLLVPVVRDADKKSIRELAEEVADLAERARQKKLQPEDMRGGSFTITNLGGIGGTAFTPIINFPQVAILGLSRGSWQPVIRDGQVVPRLLLPLSLSYDHRVIDGAAAARFTRRIAQLLENPWELLLYA
jgi:pyruvate dehydrogenase E2 component (dihydrolipoamide acetyltransferase)